MTGPTNKFCALNNLANESGVEQFLIMPLLSDLGYTADYVQTKPSVAKRFISKGS